MPWARLLAKRKDLSQAPLARPMYQKIDLKQVFFILHLRLAYKMELMFYMYVWLFLKIYSHLLSFHR